MYQVRVPKGVYPGQQFKILVNGQEMLVQCPPEAGPGHTIQIKVPGPFPANTQHRQQTKAPPPTSGSNDIGNIFSQIDKDKSGYVTPEELQHVFQHTGQKFSLRTCKLMVNLHDKDKSGKIEKSEFLQLDEYIREWQKCFHSVDTNSDGRIDKRELLEATRTFGYKFSSEFIDYMISTYDENKSGVIEFDEFIQVFVELQMLTERFKIHDKDKSGIATFTYEDFLKAFYSMRL